MNIKMVGKNKFSLVFFIMFSLLTPNVLGVMSANLDIATLNSTYVPYNSTLYTDLVTSIIFDTNYDCNPEQGEICYDFQDDNFEAGIQGGSILNLGEEMYVPKAKNNEAFTINNGEVVYISGATGENFLMELADANVHSQALRTVAIATQDIPSGHKGKFTTYGLVRDIDTSSFNEGDILYLSEIQGGLTNIKPEEPVTSVKIGYVGKSDINGTIFVKISVEGYIEELSNTESNCNDGESYEYNSTSEVWECINILDKLKPIYYDATSIQGIYGTISGQINLTQHRDGDYDGLTLNITERASAPSLDIRINFTNGIESITQGILRYYTSSIVGDHPLIQLWDYEDGVWETYGELSETLGFSTIEQSVFDSREHVQNGTVRMRLYKQQNGNINNKYYIDWLSVSKGFGVPAGEEVDPIFRDEIVNYYNKTETDSKYLYLNGSNLIVEGNIEIDGCIRYNCGTGTCSELGLCI